VQVKQFSGGFIEGDRSLQTSIGTTHKKKFNKLGCDSFLGNKVWNTAKGIDVIVGPLDFENYLKFLPKQSKLDEKVSKLQKMKEIIKRYVPFGIDVTIQFYLDNCLVKKTFLNEVSRLNKDSFIFGYSKSKIVHFSEKV
jgi:predicted component of type VI protein secretion system